MSAATSLSAQLLAIKYHVQLDESGGTSSARRRPFTRPSILFPPKEAADIDVDTIYDIAMAGFEVLENSDRRFERFRHDLFNHKTKELDRELLTADENKRVNASIASYLRLLSGYFRLSSGLKTLEYLIIRYMIHVYNMEELILCALPYHGSHVFVRIVQLINFGRDVLLNLKTKIKNRYLTSSRCKVLMQTRSEKVRTRILGLRIVKYLMERLKEEYLIFLPEMIPFLGELLEDVDLPAKSLAQEILREMESLSGESLRQYL